MSCVGAGDEGAAISSAVGSDPTALGYRTPFGTIVAQENGMPAPTLKIVCALSILLNIFLVAGLVTGLARLHGRGGMMRASMVRLVGEELPRAQSDAFRQQLRDARNQMRPLIQTGSQARIEAARLMRAPTIDQVALTAALGRARDADIAIRARMEARAVAFAATLSPADRARLADGLERQATRRHR